MWLSPIAILALTPPLASQPQDSTRVHLIDDEGTPRLIGDAEVQSFFIAPMTSLSEIVPRIGSLDGEILFQVPESLGTEFRATAWIHPSDQCVLLARGRPLLYGDLQLPASVRSEGQDVLGLLARRDGVGLRERALDEFSGRETVPEELEVDFAPEVRGDLLLFPQYHDFITVKRSVEIVTDEADDNGISKATFVTLPSAAAVAPLAGDGLTIRGKLSGLDALQIGTVQSPLQVLELGRAQGNAPDGQLAFTLPGQALVHEDGLTATVILERPEGPLEPEFAVGISTLDSNLAASWSGHAFLDATEIAGLHFGHLEGAREQLDIRPTMGPGAAWGDLNHDGLLDLVVLQGAGRPECAPLPDRVWLGAKNGSFTDITAGAGLAAGDAGMGALLVDLNGDTHLDLYCANYGQDRLFLGNGDGTFTASTQHLPELDLWSASVIAGDPDGDGDLDLYVTSYLDYDESKMPPADELDRYQREDPIEMLPFAFPGDRNVYLKNQLAETGILGFEDATEAAGLLDVQGRGMQAVFWDFDQDGDEDLYVANDVSPNVLFRNEGDGTFKDVSFATGLDDPRGGMGLAVGDIDRDGDEDLYLTNWQLEANALYENALISKKSRKRRRASFHDVTVRSGLGQGCIGKTSWGAVLFDLELDGDLDLYVANGYTSPDYESTGICVGQPDFLYRGDARGRFKLANDLAPDAMAVSLASRGVLAADHDRDGDVDLFVTANNGRLVLLRNGAKREGTWLGVHLAWEGSHNPYAIGARVEVETAAGKTQRRTLRAGEGYLTGNAPELHFGLGPTEGPVTVRVTWPDGDVTSSTHEPGQWLKISRD